MIKKLLPLILLILIGCSKDDGLHTRYYLGGDKEERTYKNGVIEGPYVYYFSNGDREESTYKNNLKEGPYVYYFSDGVRVRGNYKNGVRIPDER